MIELEPFDGHILRHDSPVFNEAGAGCAAAVPD
jgi:hypothetical protein